MRRPNTALCPNCGKTLQLPAFTDKLVCVHCGEFLRMTTSRKIYLLNPHSRYTEPSDKPEELDPEPGPPEAGRTNSAADRQRRQTSAQLASLRVVRQRGEASRILRVGLGLLVFSILFALVLVARWLLVGSAFIEWFGPALLLLALVPLSIYFVVWSSFVIRASRKEERDLKRELKTIAGASDQ